MAESGGNFDFTVPLEVSLDFSRAREDMRKGVAELQAQGVTLPVGGGTGGAASVAAAGIPVPGSPAAAISATTAAILPPTVAASAPNPAVQLAAAVANPAGAVYSAAVQAGMSPQAATAAANAATGQFFGTGGVVGAGGAVMPTGNVPGWPAGTAAWGQPAPGPSPIPAPLPPLPGQPGGGGQPGFNPYTRGLFRYGGAAFALRGIASTMEAVQQYGRDVRESEGAPNALIEADIKYRERFAGGFNLFGIPLGSGVAAGMELLTGEEEGIRRTERLSRRQDEVTASRRERMYAGRERAADAGTERQIEQTRIKYEQDVFALREHQARVNEQITATQPAQLFGIPGELFHIRSWDTYVNDPATRASLLQQSVELGRQMGESGNVQKFQEQQIRLGLAGQRMGIQAGAAGFMDVASGRMSRADIDRNAMLREQAVEQFKMQVTNPSLLGDLRIEHATELKAFDYNEQKRDHIRDIESSGVVQAAGFRAANMPFTASLAQSNAQYRADMARVAGDADEQRRIAAEGAARNAELFATESRHREMQSGVLRGETEALEYELARDPLGARLAENRFRMNAAIAALPADNLGARTQTRTLYHRREEAIEQEFADQRAQLYGGLAAGFEVARLRAGRRPGAAAAEAIFARGELESQRLALHGETEAAGIRRATTREELKAFREEYQRSLHTEEFNSLSRTALGGAGTGTENPMSVLQSIDRKLDKLDELGTVGP